MVLATCAKRQAIWTETTEKSDVNSQKPEVLKVLCAFSRNMHQPNQQKQHSYLGQSNSSPIMRILPLQCRPFMKFELVGSHNQLCTFHCLMTLLVTNLFYIHTWHQMIEAAKCDKNGMLQSVPWSVGRSLNDVTSASRRSPNQPIRCNQKHQRIFLKVPPHADNWEASNCWQSLFEEFGQSSWSFLKHHEWL